MLFRSVNNINPVEVPAPMIEKAKDNNFPAAKPLIGMPVQVNTEVLKDNSKPVPSEKPKGKD